MDGRRRRYVMHDVYFLDDSLGMAVFEQFGAPGVALWMGFIAACKKNHIEGEVSYSSDVEALSVFGLPGLELRRPNGDEFTLDEFWTLLGHHKVTARRRSGRRLHVACTRWERWQVNPRTSRAGDEKPRSDGTNTSTKSANNEHDAALETETERETETETKTAPLALVSDAPSFDDFWRSYPKKVDKAAAQKAWKSAMKRGVDTRHIVDAAKAYAADPNRSTKYTKNPASWLNAGSYDNQLPKTGTESYDEPPVRYV